MFKSMPILFLTLIFDGTIAAESETELKSNKTNKTDNNVILARSSLLLPPSVLLDANAIPLPPVQITTNAGLLGAGAVIVHAPAITNVGEVVHRVPTAISHRSQTIVHKHGDVVAPIVAPVLPVVHTRLFQTYHTPYFYTSTYISSEPDTRDQSSQSRNATSNNAR